MPITPRSFPAAKTMAVATALATTMAATWLAGCAAEPLVSGPPPGVDLTGSWKLNLNLSDDPDKLINDSSDKPALTPGTHNRRGGLGVPGGRGGIGGIDPTGGSIDPESNFSGSAGHNALPVPTVDTSALSGLRGSGIESSVPVPSSAPAASGSSDHNLSRLLPSATFMQITQSGGKITIKALLPDGTAVADEYTAGEKTTIPYGKTTAERTAGWREEVFVVTLKPKKGPSREDDYALDSDGRLIAATQLGKLVVKRVYDRVKQ